jgi:uncharacterized protein YprB with RNaseH-like and TPR domain
MANDDLRQQLIRLGVARGANHLETRPSRQRKAIEELLPGEEVYTDRGPFFLLREPYALDYRHGSHTLSELLACAPEGPAKLARDGRLGRVDYSSMAFVDTETTGLAGGTGTYAFLVGVGVFEQEKFVIHQFFMRDFGEEPAQLLALGELLDDREAVVSFNGKSFDMPLLETRFIMTHQSPRMMDAPHLDLLPASRRFWKYRLSSCSLSTLEDEILGVERTHEDVPGWLIPSLYVDYARTGDAREMPRIFYHNAQDILSLVTLTAQQCRLLDTRFPLEAQLPGEDLYGVGRLLHDLEEWDRAEAAFVEAAQTCRRPPVRELAARDLAYLLKRQERRDEALPWWRKLVETDGAVYACEELAKHYEWHDRDLAQATAWTRRAIALVESWSYGARRHGSLLDLHHRLERLERKALAE